MSSNKAVLTDRKILDIFNECPDSISTIGFARAIEAAALASADNPSQDEILSLHRQLAAEKLRADQGWARAEAKSRECIELRERMAADNPSTAGVEQGQRAPTEAMLNAARDWSVKKYGFGIGNDAATGCWQAMFDAAPVAQSTAGAAKGGIHDRTFHELAMDYRAASPLQANKAYDAMCNHIDSRLAAPAPHAQPEPAAQSGLYDAIMRLRSNKAPAKFEFAHWYKIGHRDARHAAAELVVAAESSAAQVPTAAEVPSQWISVEDRLPEKYCLAAYLARHGKFRIIRAMYVKQYEIEATGDECDSEYNEADDMEYIKAGWYECIDNWGEYSSCAVNEGEVKFWMSLPAVPEQSALRTTSKAQASAHSESGGDDA